MVPSLKSEALTLTPTMLAAKAITSPQSNPDPDPTHSCYFVFESSHPNPNPMDGELLICSTLHSQSVNLTLTRMLQASLGKSEASRKSMELLHTQEMAQLRDILDGNSTQSSHSC